MQKVKGRKQRRQQGDKRTKIFEAARTIFCRKGYENTTMVEIGKEAAVATGTIYEYFENKEDLFFAVAAERYGVFAEEFKEQLAGLKCPLERIRKYIWFYLYFFQRDPVYAELWLFNIKTNKRLTDSSAYPWTAQSGREIMEILEEGQAESRIRKDVDLFVTRHLILGSLEHVLTRWLLKEKSYDLLAYSEKISDLVVEAISVK